MMGLFLDDAASYVRNGGSIDNLPEDCCTEVPCLVDRAGVQPTAATRPRWST